jgi:hypothetical protein
MPYLDFNTTKNLRDAMLSRTLNPIYKKSPSPKTFTATNYGVQSLGDVQNLNLPDLDSNRANDLAKPQSSNIFKPKEYLIKDMLVDIPRRANLNLYPYFSQTNENLIGIMSTTNYDTESELFKFAAYNIRTNQQGPVLARIKQNLYTATTAKNKIGEALGGNTTTLINIIRGKQPLIEGNNKITVANSLLGKGIDFLQTVAGVEFPWSEIPGDYLTNPRSPINVRPTKNSQGEEISQARKIWQDVTGVLGSVVGIQRRPLPTRKPSDLLIEYMGSSSKNRLFDLLSYSKYAPDYSTTARSQQSSKLFNIPGQILQGVKKVLGEEAPTSGAYIGDDRANDVKQATTEILSGRPVRSNYYLSLMFDKTAAELFHSSRNYSQQGKLAGSLTWISKNKKGTKPQNVFGTLSTSYNFREDSILNTTQQILDSNNGDNPLTHIGSIIDQTTKYFKEGDTLISRGSAVKYIDNSGKEAGIEYARVWTKESPYIRYMDTMPYHKESIDKPYYKKSFSPYRRKNIRKYDGSVLSNTWNLNIAPMSDGMKGFGNSTNISKKGDGFYAKKYMLSIENLAWKSSTIPGFTVNDLPYSERGPNGGRVMWFPPYDLKVSEQNTAKWEENSFLGRPEPIFTYQNTTRSGQLSFKIVVDHPSVLNLLVREHFKLMSEDQVNDYLHSFFAGAKDIDFYSLVRTYTNLDSDDLKMIKDYLNSGGDPSDVNRYKEGVNSKVNDNPEGTNTENANSENVSVKVNLGFSNSSPFMDKGKDSADYYSIHSYSDITDDVIKNKSGAINLFTQGLNRILNGTTPENKTDRFTIFGTEDVTDSASAITLQTTKLNDYFTKMESDKLALQSGLEDLKNDLINKSVSKDVIILIGSNTTQVGDTDYNFKLSARRSNSILKYVIEKLQNDVTPVDKWNFSQLPLAEKGYESLFIDVQYDYKELGYKDLEGTVYIRTSNYGENKNDCKDIKFNDGDLTRFSPQSYGCRQSIVSVDYDRKQKTPKAESVVSPNGATKITPTGNVSTTKTKPPIDVMKRIIMKTLSEEYYFKKLEETSPLVFTSLKEKFRYFHPAFHSTTPEGLNARLTFLQQCLRPGSTIPVKGTSDSSDIDARNTSFGPPPICVLRVGDFYHSKIVIRDLNITFEDANWDMNTEGIGVQPMLANVTLQLNFIGGQGLEKPIQKLQNALSSNFYANTEMYDERSESTNSTIGGVDTNKFTKKFLEDLQNDYIAQTTLKDKNGNDFLEGQYIGEFSGKTALNYTSLIDDLYKKVDEYHSSYEQMYNKVLTEFGDHITRMVVDKEYRTIKDYDVFQGMSPTIIELNGLYPSDLDLGKMVIALKNKLKSTITVEKMSTYYGYDDAVTDNYKTEANSTLYTHTINKINEKLDTLPTLSAIKDYEDKRDGLILILDKLNFISKFGYDVKYEKSKTTKANFSGYTNATYYDEYKTCIDYITTNKDKFYSKLNKKVEFRAMSGIDDDTIGDMISALLQDDKDGINTILRTEKWFIFDGVTNKEGIEALAKIMKKVGNKLKKPSDVNIKFTKAPKRKNSKPVVYTILNQDLDTTTDEIKNLFTTKQNPPKNNKLNYYRK